MNLIESGKTVLHRGREAPEILEEETAELAEEQRAKPTPEEQQRMIAQRAYYRALETTHDATQARLTVQRKIVSTLRAMWINQTPYCDELLR